MGDYQLTWPGPRRPSLLGAYHLHLDPQIEAEIRAIEARQNFERLREVWLRPDWWRLDQILPPQPQWLRMRPAAPSPPLVPRGAGPDTPRPGEISDLMKAIWGDRPHVQRADGKKSHHKATKNTKVTQSHSPTAARAHRLCALPRV